MVFHDQVDSIFFRKFIGLVYGWLLVWVYIAVNKTTGDTYRFIYIIVFPFLLQLYHNFLNNTINQGAISRNSFRFVSTRGQDPESILHHPTMIVSCSSFSAALRIADLMTGSDMAQYVQGCLLAPEGSTG